MAARGWILTTRRLPLGSGLLATMSPRLRVAVLDRHFSDLGTDPEAVDVPVEDLGREVDAFVIRPHPVGARLPLFSRARGTVRYVPVHYRRSMTRLSGTFDAYLRGMSPKTRQTLQRAVRRYLERAGTNEPLVELAGEAGIREFYDRARVIAGKTYQEDIVGGGLPKDPAFAHEMVRLAAEGRATGYLLLFQATPIAYIYVAARHGVAMYDYTGFDPAYRDVSPGKVLLYLLLQRLFEQGAYRALDYGEGEGPHKDLFATDQILCGDVYYFRPTPRGLLVLGAHAGRHLLARGVRRWRARAGAQPTGQAAG